MVLLSSVDFFFKINFFKKAFREHYQGVKRFGSRLGPTFCSVGPLDQNCRQTTNLKERVKGTEQKQNRTDCLFDINQTVSGHSNIQITQYICHVS